MARLYYESIEASKPYKTETSKIAENRPTGDYIKDILSSVLNIFGNLGLWIWNNPQMFCAIIGISFVITVTYKFCRYNKRVSNVRWALTKTAEYLKKLGQKLYDMRTKSDDTYEEIGKEQQPAKQQKAKAVSESAQTSTKRSNEKVAPDKPKEKYAANKPPKLPPRNKK